MYVTIACFETILIDNKNFIKMKVPQLLIMREKWIDNPNRLMPETGSSQEHNGGFKQKIMAGSSNVSRITNWPKNSGEPGWNKWLRKTMRKKRLAAIRRLLRNRKSVNILNTIGIGLGVRNTPYGVCTGLWIARFKATGVNRRITMRHWNRYQ